MGQFNTLFISPMSHNYIVYELLFNSIPEMITLSLIDSRVFINIACISVIGLEFPPTF